jgi:lipoprotein-anchoring transpeptidase ErfK/SrfK
MRYTAGEVTLLASATMAVAAVGAGMTFADRTPHYREQEIAASAAVEMGPAATAGADYARPAVKLPTPAAAPGPASSPIPSPVPELVIRRVLPIEGAIRYGEWHWDETGAPATGVRVITVDLDARVISIFRDGYEIGAAAVLLGTQQKPTPTGVFPISEKDAKHVSNLYDAPMPYMLRLTDDGVTIHATNVQNGYASHGCIGVPMEFARRLFATVRLGDRVYITRGKHVGVGDSLT